MMNFSQDPADPGTVAGTLSPLEVVTWNDGAVRLIDQRRLPAELTYIDCRTQEELWDAIKTLAVRGAPAIGVAAAYGAAMSVHCAGSVDTSELLATLEKACDYLATRRPPASVTSRRSPPPSCRMVRPDGGSLRRLMPVSVRRLSPRVELAAAIWTSVTGLDG